MPLLYLPSTDIASLKGIAGYSRLWHGPGMTIGARIAQAREQQGHSQSALARILCVRSQTINKWEHNVTSPSRDHVVALARELNASVAWLLYGHGKLTEQVANSTIPPLHERGTVLAMVSVTQAATRKIPSEPAATINAVMPITGDACAITLPDDSNAPDHPAGTIWALSYDERPRPGDMVLAQHGETLEPILGEYSVATTEAGRVRFVTPKNARWPVARSDIERLEIVAVMVADIRPRRK